MVPATFPSHQGLVLPLKLWRPRWFDGVALAVGAGSPDAAYLLDGSGLPVWPFSHEPVGLLGWCLPVTVVICWLLRRAAPAVAAHAPRVGGLALPDYGAVGRASHRWWVTASSAIVGAASHLALDLVEVAGPFGAATEPVLHLLGGLGTAAVLLRIGRRRLIRRWHGPPPPVPQWPLLFWSVAASVAVAGFLVVPRLPAANLIHVTGVRLIAVAAVSLLAAAACTTCATRLRGAGWIS